MDDLEPSDVARALDSVPLFREIQKLLLASTGSVNWEIAQQIAVGLADARPGVPADQRDRDQLNDDYRIAEMRISSLTGMDAGGRMTEVTPVDRKTWVTTALDSLRPHLDQLAQRLGGQVDVGDGGRLGGLIAGLAPAAFGVQFGMMFGALSRRILSRAELAFMDADGKVPVVFPNVVEMERELQLDPAQFRLWLMLNEAVRDLLATSVPWLADRQRQLVLAYVDAAAIDPDAIASKLSAGTGPEEVMTLLEKPDQLIPLLQTDEQKAIARQLTALMTVIEGYADHVIDRTGQGLLPDLSRISESVARRRAAPSSAERLYEALLGIDLKGEQYRAGSRYVAAVASADALDKLWDGPHNLPSPEEIEDPTAWLDRVIFS